MGKRFQAIREKLQLDDSAPKSNQEAASDIKFLLQVISIYYQAMLTCDAIKVLEAIKSVEELDVWEEVV
jgi:hypothetical protein